MNSILGASPHMERFEGAHLGEELLQKLNTHPASTVISKFKVVFTSANMFQLNAYLYSQANK